MAPVIKSVEDVLAHIETSEDDRYDALPTTLAVANWRSAADPRAAEFPSWEAWVTATQVGSALFAAGTADEGPVSCRIGNSGETSSFPRPARRTTSTPGTG
ncbi:immunity 49 family protein [Streptomyces jietaisiensis]|uniref:Immunity 49 family protein n=1 Tax=Streptomyces griseoaurantiacus TaxID=68213 RepID=A0ABZ1V152_9ACTN|nr:MULTISPECIES: hypothetical protein [Streptomyces]MDX3091740.1 hypothetical protein [Streptomyces sp. ME12-02E]MDX3335310.1 hypothetical protein [Streptomyces sp. ME02-6978a]MDX3360871.1 hypothetical protein [Streptomyces sp. ME02-6978.2a]